MKNLLLAATALLAAPIAQASTLVVTEAADTVANNGRCSLREAITAANTGLPSGAAAGECGQGVAAPYDRIDVPAGDYRLERAGTGEDNNVNGDLDIRSANLELRGAGADVVTVRGDREERVFDVGTPAAPAGAHVTIVGMTIRNGSDTSGGGIRARAGWALRVADCALSNNAAATAGGIDAAGGLEIDGCAFHANSATDATGNGGGALRYTGTSAALIRNTTFNANESATSASVVLINGPMAFNNVTLTENIADADFNGTGDGAIVANGDVAVSNSIIARNVDLSVAIGGPNNPDCVTSPGMLLSQGYNLIGNPGTSCTFIAGPGDQIGSAAAPLDPKLEPFAVYGGTVETQPPRADSPAIDAGNPAAPGAAPACEVDDARGIARPSGPRCDIGAVEINDRIFANGFELPAP